MANESNPRKGLFYASAGMLLVSTNFVTAKYALGGFNPQTFSAVWTTAAAFYALGIIAALGLTKRLRVARHSAPWLLLMGGLTAASMLLEWSGLQRLDPTFAAFLKRGQPVILVLMGAVFLRERFRAKEILPAVLMLVGGFVSVVGRWQQVGLGVIFVVCGALAVCLQWFIAKVYSRDVHPEVLVFYRLAPAAIILWGALGATHSADFHVPARYWVVLFVGAFLGPCLSHVMTFRAYRHWDLSRATLVLTLQPVVVLPLALVFLGRLPSGQALVGGSIILLGALWMVWMHWPGRGSIENE